MELTKRHLLYWRLKNQFLVSRGKRLEVVSKLLGLQAQFANNPKYALRIRAADFDEETWSDGLVKTWIFRHTLHVIPSDELGLYHSAYEGVPGDWVDDWGMKASRIESVAAFLMERIRAGLCGRADLKEQCREFGLSEQEMAYAFNGWGGIFSQMFRRGLIAYHPGVEKKFIVCKNVKFIDRDAARIELIRRYFRNIGPAKKEDCYIFMGYYLNPRKAAQELMEAAGLEAVTCEGEEYFYLGSIPEEGEIPKCLFLAGFDRMIMGYKNTNRTYLIDKKNMHEIVTPQGIAFPTVLLDGRVCAKWKMGNPVLVTPLENISAKNRRLIQNTGEEYFKCDVIFK
ncbi:hypothetical protein FACS189479_05850 [Spirochaetia bacterium]|nr:hypothetical protein FACS189479_05850 [Spirochaetia bacterium]